MPAGDVSSGQVQGVGELLAVGGQHPAGEDGQAPLAVVGRNRSGSGSPVQCQFAGRSAGELLDLQRSLRSVARGDLPGDVTRRVVRAVRAQAGEIFLACVALLPSQAL